MENISSVSRFKTLSECAEEYGGDVNAVPQYQKGLHAEYVIKQLFEQRGCKVELHPESSSSGASIVDLKVIQPDNKVIYVEVKVRKNIFLNGNYKAYTIPKDSSRKYEHFMNSHSNEPLFLYIVDSLRGLIFYQLMSTLLSGANIRGTHFPQKYELTDKDTGEVNEQLAFCVEQFVTAIPLQKEYCNYINDISAEAILPSIPTDKVTTTHAENNSGTIEQYAEVISLPPIKTPKGQEIAMVSVGGERFISYRFLAFAVGYSGGTSPNDKSELAQAFRASGFKQHSFKGVNTAIAFNDVPKILDIFIKEVAKSNGTKQQRFCTNAKQLLEFWKTIDVSYTPDTKNSEQAILMFESEKIPTAPMKETTPAQPFNFNKVKQLMEALSNIDKNTPKDALIDALNYESYKTGWDFSPLVECIQKC